MDNNIVFVGVGFFRRRRFLKKKRERELNSVMMSEEGLTSK